MPPIRKGDGTAVVPKGISQIRTGDGRILFDGDAIPDNGMFQEPVFQWWAGEGIDVDDGETASTWDDVLEDVTANAINTPKFRDDQAGIPAVEYDGNDDGHEFESDSALPTGDDPFTVIGLCYVNDVDGENTLIGWGNQSQDEGFWCYVLDGNVQVTVWGSSDANGGNPSQGEWITFGARFDSDNMDAILDGSQVASESVSMDSLADSNRGIGRDLERNGRSMDGFIAEVVVSSTDESDTALSEYHDDRMELVN